APHVLALADVGHVDRQFDDVGHGSAGCRKDVADLREYDLRLLVLARAFDGAEIGAAARRHAGDVGDAVDDEAIGPEARRRFRDLVADGAFDSRHGPSRFTRPAVARGANESPTPISGMQA